MKVWTGLILAAFFALIIYAESDLPAVGDPQAPTRVHVTRRYIEGALPDMHTPNIVTAVLADYRGYDTLGETAVILAAGMAVSMILPRALRRRKKV